MSKADAPRQSLLPPRGQLAQEVMVKCHLHKVPGAHALTGTERRALAASAWGEERGEPFFNGDQNPVGQEGRSREWIEAIRV